MLTQLSNYVLLIIYFVLSSFAIIGIQLSVSKGVHGFCNLSNPPIVIQSKLESKYMHGLGRYA